ncbi:MAG: C2H2-type zinc finger protein [Phycisphaerae bacterium]|nr:C2H2-type zinc finger protein [Phycisphaerae bacterium]
MPRKKTGFRCSECGKAFKMAMHLGRHMTTIHGQSKTPPAAKARPTKKVRGTASDGLAAALVAMIDKLQAQRREHVDAIAKIDALFEKYGIQLPERKRRGRPPGRKPGRKPGRPAAAGCKGRRWKGGTFAKSGIQSVLDFVKGKGKLGATSAEINKQWKSEGRGATADTTLSQLSKQKKLKREEIKGTQGSRYTAA